MRQHVADVRRDTEAAQARLKTMEARSAPTAALATQALLSSDAAPPRVLADLAALMPPDVKLDSLALNYGEGIGMNMHVSAKTARRVRGLPPAPGGFAFVRRGGARRGGAGRRRVRLHRDALPRRLALIARGIAALLVAVGIALYAAVAVPMRHQAQAAADDVPAGA